MPISEIDTALEKFYDKKIPKSTINVEIALMKKPLLKCATLTLALSAMSVSYAGIFGPSLSSDMDKVSYSIGYDIGSNFKSQNINIEPDPFQGAHTYGLHIIYTLFWKHTGG
jgi:hypothetical protein